VTVDNSDSQLIAKFAELQSGGESAKSSAEDDDVCIPGS